MKKKELTRFTEKLMEEKSRLLNHSDKKEDLQMNHDDLADEVDLASSELNQNVLFRCPNIGSLLDEKIYY